MNTTERFLISLLAATDAIFYPHRGRYLGSTVPQVLYERRKGFPTLGIPWNSRWAGARSVADRKAAQRLLADLDLQGAVVLGSPRGRTVGVRLTPRGDDFTRAICGLPTRGDAVPLLAQLESLAAGSTDRVRETTLAGVEYGTPDHTRILARLETRFSPLLCCTVVVSGSDMQGHVSYSATGKTAPADTLGKKRPAEVAGAFKLYRERVAAELAAFESEEPEDKREIGLMPLSAGV